MRHVASKWTSLSSRSLIVLMQNLFVPLRRQIEQESYYCTMMCFQWREGFISYRENRNWNIESKYYEKSLKAATLICRNYPELFIEIMNWQINFKCFAIQDKPSTPQTPILFLAKSYTVEIIACSDKHMGWQTDQQRCCPVIPVAELYECNTKDEKEAVQGV